MSTTYNYDFRVLIETLSGSKYSYGTGSFISVTPGLPVTIPTSGALERMVNMPSMSYFNNEHYQSGSLYTANTDFLKGNFTNTQLLAADGAANYQFLSASIINSPASGSIKFEPNMSVAWTGSNGKARDFIKRYKFFGNKVCNVLGIPEDFWIYSDRFRLANTGSDQNIIRGDVLGNSLHVKKNLAISNAGNFASDIPFHHAQNTDRWVKWTNTSGSLPQNDMLIGYSNLSDDYMIRMKNGKRLVISGSNTDLEVNEFNNINVSGKSILNMNFTSTNQADGTFQISNNSGIVTLENTYNSNIGNMIFQVHGFANSIVIDRSAQSVGIGTSGPDSTLEVDGDFTATNITASGNIKIDGYITASGDLFLSDTDGSPSLHYDVSANELNTAGATFHINKSNGVDTSFDDGTLYVDASENNVGIRVTDPSAPLEVRGDIGTAGINQITAGTDQIKIHSTTAGSGAGIGFSDHSSEDQSGHLRFFMTDVDNDTDTGALFRLSSNQTLAFQITGSGDNVLALGKTQIRENDGKIGIMHDNDLGNPHQLLHLQSTSAPQLLIEESDSRFVRLGVEDTADDMCLGWDDGDDMHFGVFASTTDVTLSSKMIINSSGDVYIGTTTTTTGNRLYVYDAPGSGTPVNVVVHGGITDGNNNDVMLLKQLDKVNSDSKDRFLNFMGAGSTYLGSIKGDGSGGVDYETSFTGKHASVMKSGSYETGMIVESTGEVWGKRDDGTHLHTGLPKVQITTTNSSKKIYGVIGELDEYDTYGGYNDNFGVDSDEIPVTVHSIGEGLMIVTNVNGNVENGDYIVSSDIAGYGQKQDDDILRSSTVAKCTETIDWNNVTDTITHNGVQYKKYITTCTYHCG
ncbi:MAG: hypothetical protein CBB96_05180 [Gammaproteobacteria bacterium TMED36]|nr:MAG: hypothetical protein CBB96_05180 [Gammaproteobacteria bacterium TMED36]|tara:strand:+ start:2234 stop:4810 length:2577 start_codon:yes stop_codon:yes gene_type:complete